MGHLVMFLPGAWKFLSFSQGWELGAGVRGGSFSSLEILLLPKSCPSLSVAGPQVLQTFSVICF